MNIARPQTHKTPPQEANDHSPEPTARADYTTADWCIERLRHFKKSGSSKPWLLHCSINIPHYPFQTEPKWLEKVKVDEIPRPQWIEESRMHPADSYSTISKNMNLHFNDSQINLVQRTYYAMNVETDHILGTIIDSALDNGFNLNNTVFAFISDHGELNMEHRQCYKNSMFEGSARIPMVFAGLLGVEKLC